MSKSIFAAALFALIALGACKKNDDNPDFPANYLEKGALTFKNNSADLYDIYLDNARYGNLYGGDSSTYPNITAGVHQVKAIQVEHISGTPILRQMNILIVKDSTTRFEFP
ncbi:MAG: hypothetical protein JST06_05130 [Bacteroidetes bacterium]|nr:hypothetical protein [Bacteroidota bacterium]MBS1629811.1 hypothetical protein [Bacteroidota bacterium]